MKLFPAHDRCYGESERERERERGDRERERETEGERESEERERARRERERERGESFATRRVRDHQESLCANGNFEQSQAEFIHIWVLQSTLLHIPEVLVQINGFTANCVWRWCSDV